MNRTVKQDPASRGTILNYSWQATSDLLAGNKKQGWFMAREVGRTKERAKRVSESNETILVLESNAAVKTIYIIDYRNNRRLDYSH